MPDRHGGRDSPVLRRQERGPNHVRPEAAVNPADSAGGQDASPPSHAARITNHRRADANERRVGANERRAGANEPSVGANEPSVLPTTAAPVPTSRPLGA